MGSQSITCGSPEHGSAVAAPRWLVEFTKRVKWIRKALALNGGTHEDYDIAAGIQDGRFQLFVHGDTIAITELVVYPNGKDLNIFLAGGHLDELEEAIPGVEEFARREGCKRITLTGRCGWSRSFLRKRGYEVKRIVMMKELG